MRFLVKLLGLFLAAGSAFGQLSRERLEAVTGYLESEVDRLSVDIQRLNEESEFFQKLLTERSSQGAPPPPPGERTS